MDFSFFIKRGIHRPDRTGTGIQCSEKLLSQHEKTAGKSKRSFLYIRLVRVIDIMIDLIAGARVHPGLTGLPVQGLTDQPA